MIATVNSLTTTGLQKFRSLFTSRDFIFNDGRELREFSVGGRAQALMAGVAAVTLCFSAYGVTQAASGAAIGTSDAQLAEMEREVAEMQADVAKVRTAAAEHAKLLEQRQALIVAAMAGEGDPADFDLAALTASGKIDAQTAEILAPLRRAEAGQMAMVVKANAALQARYAETARELRRMGLTPNRIASQAAMGGPLEEVNENNAADASADAQFRSLVMSWKRLDSLEEAAIAIPSMQPVAEMRLTSSFGVRSDPFRGTQAMHAGLDIPGPVGTPIYATADGIVSRSQRAGAYGLLVEVNHGKGIQTRYAHLSKMLVDANTRVRRGQLIGLMGSTGRSTGPHLHYEVRIDGRAVNPTPYIQAGDQLVAMQDRALKSRNAAGMGGPEK
ncbi:M23 family metallopeptidase [Sphingomonas sp. AX6]|uniref:M23 family metallopeptidase n=1 Tax=Sphingomonas sp. AX6 TaxID=2653171 RepID=UPI0012F11651|nr:M23 family metallopeptidase [Sphingomonas sp. AX6]VXC80687.1 Murein DD-endopeptidase MepM/ murein hydrolase activator NlpD [Sphingomonas sp. AX6]